MKITLLAPVIVALALISGRSDALPESRILDGTVVTDPLEFPFLVAVSSTDGTKFCSGFIYSDWYVITAASCVFDSTGTKILPTKMKVTVGMTSQLSTGPYQADYLISAISTINGYNPLTNKNKDNIAILKLSKAIIFSPGVYYKHYNEVDNTVFTATTMGWGGQTDTAGVAIKLRKAKAVIERPATCDAIETGFSDKKICTSADTLVGGGTPCGEFDDGAPLLQGDVIVGILSQSGKCTSPLPTPNYSQFTRLSAHFFWIRSIAGPLPTPTPLPTTTQSTTTGLPTAPCIGCAR